MRLDISYWTRTILELMICPQLSVRAGADGRNQTSGTKLLIITCACRRLDLPCESRDIFSKLVSLKFMSPLRILFMSRGSCLIHMIMLHQRNCIILCCCYI